MTLEDKMAEFDRQVRSTEYDIQVYLPIYTFPIQFLLLRDLRRETRRYSQKVSAQLARQIQKLVITSDSSLKTRMLMRTYKCRKFRELMDSIPEGKQVEFVESIGSVAYNSMSGGATRTYVNLASQDPSKIEKSIDIARRVGKIAPVADFRPVTRSLMQLVKGKDIQYAHEIITKCEAFAYSTIGGGANSKLSKIYRLKEFKSLFEWPVASLEAIGQGFQSVWDLVHIRKYLSLCHELPQFEPHVYWELGRFYNF